MTTTGWSRGSCRDNEQQSVLLLHRTRNLLVRQRTMLVNALRAHMAEFGMGSYCA